MGKACWIWYPGDFEIYHGMRQNFTREERGYGWPAYWHMDDWRKNLRFHTTVNTEKSISFTVYGNGTGHVLCDGKKYRLDREITLEEGNHDITVCIGNMTGLPAIFVEGDIESDPDLWTVDDFIETHPVGFSSLYQDKNVSVEEVPYVHKTIQPINKKMAESVQGNAGLLVEFDHVINGLVIIDTASDGFDVCYGESEAEALDEEWCYYKEEGYAKENDMQRRAFRYVFLPGVKEAEVSADDWVFPHDVKGSFQCSDEKMNRIYQTAVDTYLLCGELFHIDGIKRDRWIWSGDAYESYKVNPYLLFDKEIDKRTVRALRGNDLIRQHINTITDYSMIWVISVLEEYRMDGNKDFLKEQLMKLQTMMAFLMSQRDEEGFFVGREGDWIYLDWAEFDHEGPLCGEQIFFWETLLAMQEIYDILGIEDRSYEDEADMLREKIIFRFFDKDRGFIDSFVSGKNHVTRHANILAILFDFVESEMQEIILDKVLLNDEVPAITTPYFRFYELDALAKAGRLREVYDAILSYWGGMIEEGAVTFWEAYDPKETGNARYAMYGDPFGKSLCHAWGAGPIYLLGRYFLGVRPSSYGYETFEVEPHPEFFKSLKADIPVNEGIVHIEINDTELTVTSTKEGGTLVYNGERIPIPVEAL